MSVLLMRLAGPMQSWGTRSRFPIRDTGLEPSRSGVAGLLCAGLGRRRGESIDDLAQLTMAVRVDREGSLARDYQTAENVIHADAGDRRTVQSWRDYLADADFLVALSGPKDLLDQLHRALARPVHPLSLGRKSYVPGVPPYLPDGLTDASDPIQALRRWPWRPPERRRPDHLRLVRETDDPTFGTPRQDVPLSFERRDFTVRYVVTDWLDTADLPEAEEHSLCI